MKRWHIEIAQNHMATTFSLTLSVCREDFKKAERALLSAHRRIAELESELSEFVPASAIALLNSARPQKRIQISQDAFTLLTQAEKIKDCTGAAFDCTVKSRGITNPKLGLDSQTREVWKMRDGAWLSFGAIGKGYALDRAAELLEHAGFTHYLLNAGGSSLILSGLSTEDAPWSWGWSWKKDEQGDDLGVPFSHASGERIAIGISGIHEKGAHLKDPRNGLSVMHAQSALVATKSATEADALSTALYVSGWKEGAPLLEKNFCSALGFVDWEDRVQFNQRFQQIWGSR